MCAHAHTHTQLRPIFVIPWTVACGGSSVHQILQARMLKWVAISYPRGIFLIRDQIHVSCVSCPGRRMTTWVIWVRHKSNDKSPYKRERQKVI